MEERVSYIYIYSLLFLPFWVILVIKNNENILLELLNF